MSGDLFTAWGIDIPRPLVKSAEWREEQLFLTEPLQGDLFLDGDADTGTDTE